MTHIGGDENTVDLFLERVGGIRFIAKHLKTACIRDWRNRNVLLIHDTKVVHDGRLKPVRLLIFGDLQQVPVPLIWFYDINYILRRRKHAEISKCECCVFDRSRISGNQPTNPIRSLLHSSRSRNLLDVIDSNFLWLISDSDIFDCCLVKLIFLSCSSCQ